MNPAPLLLAFTTLLAASATLGADGYASVAAWNDDASTLGFQVEAFDKCRGHLAEKHKLGPCLQMWDDALKRRARMDAYARQRLAGDAANAENLELDRRAKDLGAKLDEAVAFLKPEIRKMGRTKVNAITAVDKAASKYRKTLDEFLRN
jgi:oligoendopeptidase F